MGAGGAFRRFFSEWAAKYFAFFRAKCYNGHMEYSYLRELDEFFCAQFADYTRIAAIPGYRMPEMLTVGADGNITRKDSRQMRLAYQPDPRAVLENFKAGLEDTHFTFSFSYPRPF